MKQAFPMWADQHSGTSGGSLRDMRGVGEAEEAASLFIPPLQWGHDLASIIIIIIIIEQIKNFEYLGCEIYCENEDVKQKLFCSNTGKSEQVFYTNFGPEMFSDKST